MSDKPFNPIKIKDYVSKEDKISYPSVEERVKRVNEIEQHKICLPELDKTGKNTGLGPHAYRFDFERKSAFLRLAVEFWPNITKIAAAVGVSRPTVDNHRKMDPAFNQALKDIDDMVCDEHEEVLRSEGMKPKGFLDRMAYLRAHRPELYDRAKVVKIEGYKMNSAERSQRIGAVDTAIDAEIVKTYLDRKQRRELKQQQRLGGEGTTGGEQKAGGGDETKA